MAYHSYATAAAQGECFPRIVADVGGTNARFALETSPRVYEQVQVLACNAYPTFEAALRRYMDGVDEAGRGIIRAAGIAIANPVDGPEVRMTNHHWSFCADAVRESLGLDALVVMNDFAALAMSIPHLPASSLLQVGGGETRERATIGLIGAGTGLGVSGLVPSGTSWVALDSEGGHVTFSPANHREVDILQILWRTYGHVSAERLLSGEGLQLMYRALCDLHGTSAAALAPADIVARGIDGTCAICDETVETFCAMLGTAAANLAITLGAAGGIYIGGGIVPRLGERFMRSSFRARFEDKGRFAGYLARIPVFLITAEHPAFLGVSACLSSAGSH